jgi:hypothetical protein
MLRFASTLLVCFAFASAARALDAEDEPAAALDMSPAMLDFVLPSDAEIRANTRPPTPPPRYHRRPELPSRLPPSIGGWPRLLVLSASFTFASVDYRNAVFEERGGMAQLSGRVLRLRRFDAPGGDVSMRLAPTPFLEIGLGVGVLMPRVGTPLPAATPRAESVAVTKAHVAYWHAQFDLVAHMGALSLSFGAYVGWQRMVIELEGDGPSEMRSARPTAGPRIALRAHLYRSLFLHVGGSIDLLEWPDGQLQVGLGLAHR